MKERKKRPFYETPCIGANPAFVAFPSLLC